MQTFLLSSHTEWQLGRLKGTKLFYITGLLKQGVQWLWVNCIRFMKAGPVSQWGEKRQWFIYKTLLKRDRCIREIAANKQINKNSICRCHMQTHTLRPKVSHHPQNHHPFLSAIYYAQVSEKDLIWAVWLPTRHHSHFGYLDWFGQICTCWLEKPCVLMALTSARKVHGSPADCLFGGRLTLKATEGQAVNKRKKAGWAFAGSTLQIALGHLLSCTGSISQVKMFSTFIVRKHNNICPWKTRCGWWCSVYCTALCFVSQDTVESLEQVG